MSVSLIVTTYNRPDALELSLLSALDQIEQPDEILVADDGSDGETADLVGRMSKTAKIPILHVWQEDRGFRAAMIRNKAIARARGDYIVFVDGDMILHASFIADHKSAARTGSFSQGSRVLVSDGRTLRILRDGRAIFRPFQSGLSNRKNGMRSPFLSKLFLRRSNSLKGIRTCNFALWKSDAVAVNGFNEDFTGWGREDSEFAARLLNKGIFRQNIKFMAIAYHLAHPHHPTHSLAINDEMLRQTIENRSNWCSNGIDKYSGG
jgi:glycosyltransferase involved in cell wall biosynthesis